MGESCLENQFGNISQNETKLRLQNNIDDSCLYTFFYYHIFHISPTTIFPDI